MRNVFPQWPPPLFHSFRKPQKRTSTRNGNKIKRLSLQNNVKCCDHSTSNIQHPILNTSPDNFPWMMQDIFVLSSYFTRGRSLHHALRWIPFHQWNSQILVSFALLQPSPANQTRRRLLRICAPTASTRWTRCMHREKMGARENTKAQVPVGLPFAKA